MLQNFHLVDLFSKLNLMKKILQKKKKTWGIKIILFIQMDMIVLKKKSLTKTKSFLYTEELFKAVLVKPMGREHNTAHSKHIT